MAWEMDGNLTIEEVNERRGLMLSWFNRWGYGWLAEDLVQEVMIKVWQRLDSIDRERMIGWLYTVSRNVMVDYIRRSSSRPMTFPLSLLNSEGEDLMVDDQMAQFEAEYLVRELAGQLSSVQQSVVIGYYVYNLKDADLAGVLGIPIGSVKSRLHWARRKLRRLATR